MSYNPGPANGGSNNPQVVTGGVAGTVVGREPSEAVGFYGAAGSVQLSGGAITTVADLVAALQTLGLLGA